MLFKAREEVLAHGRLAAGLGGEAFARHAQHSHSDDGYGGMSRAVLVTVGGAEYMPTLRM